MSELAKGSLAFKGDKGDTGEIGTPIPYDGTFEQLKNSDEDKYHNYIILNDLDTNYVGHWVYYDRKSSSWKDGGVYQAQQLTDEIKKQLERYEAQIENMANSEPQSPEIVDARSGFSTLRKRLDNTDNKKADKTTTDNLQNQINVEKARIDNMAQLPEGSTTGDAELQDIRVGADGKTYNSAGEAVRGQIGKVSSKVDDVVAPVNLIDLNNLTKNKVVSGAGEVLDNDFYHLSSPIEVSKGDVITFLATHIPNYDGIYAIAFYNSNDNFTARYTYDDGEAHSLTIPASISYIRVIIGKNATKPILVKGSYLPEYGECGTRKILESAIPVSIKERLTNNESNIEALSNNVSDINNEINKELTITLEKAENYIQKFKIVAGKTYLITNTSKSSTAVSIYTRLNSDDTTNTEIIADNLSANTSIKFTATQNANYIRGYMNNAGSVKIVEQDTIKNSVENLSTNLGLPFMQDKVSGANMYEYKIVANKNYLLKNTSKSASLNCFTRASKDGENIETVATNLGASKYSIFTATQNASYLRFFFNSTGSFEFYEMDKVLGRIENLEIKSTQEKVAPLVEFNIDYNMRDLTNEMNKIDYSPSGKSTILEQVYSLFDNLVTNYSDYVSKVDAAELVNLTYPSYANGITNSDTYLDTAAYKTYMYKFVCSNDYVGNGKDGKNPKKKLLIVSGTHGNEIAAPFNSYLFAKQLCDGFLEDENFYKLRSAFDIYIIPCLNGYGMYHLTRANANKVNINRNYPIKNWAVNGEDTKDSATGCNYTGLAAGSEFETQLVMAITSLIKPDLAIDHHNYSGTSKWQFYTEVNDENGLKLAYQSLVDCSYTFKKKYPNYFGSNFSLLQESSGSAPGNLASFDGGTTCRWWFENNVSFASTVEISECINYLNGVYNNTFIDDFGSDSFSVAEYTFRNLLLRYAQNVLNTTDTKIN